MLLTDNNLEGPSEAVQVFNTRFQHLTWPRLRWLLLRHCPPYMINLLGYTIEYMLLHVYLKFERHCFEKRMCKQNM